MESRALSPIRNGRVGDWRLADAEFVASFRLPTLNDKYDKLQEQHPHPRDKRISFDEEAHTYTIDGCFRAPKSVTTLVHEYGYSFDPIAAVATMKAGARWEERRDQFVNSDGSEMTNDEIIEMWHRKGRIASSRGTLLHWRDRWKTPLAQPNQTNALSLCVSRLRRMTKQTHVFKSLSVDAADCFARSRMQRCCSTAARSRCRIHRSFSRSLS